MLVLSLGAGLFLITPLRTVTLATPALGLLEGCPPKLSRSALTGVCPGAPPALVCSRLLVTEFA